VSTTATPNYSPACRIVVNGVELRGERADDISHIEVVQEPNTLDHLRLTLANDNPDFVYAIEGGAQPDLFGIFREGNAIELSLGYGSALEEVFAGEITGIVANFPESEAATIEVHCHSFLHRLIGSALTRTYLKMKDSAIAALVGREAGLRVQARDTMTRHDFVLQYNQTNLEFLLELASRNGFELLVRGKTLFFQNPGDTRAAEVTLTYGGAPDPLLSVWLKEELLGQRGKVTVRAVNQRGETIVGTAQSGQVDSPPPPAQLGASIARKAFGATEAVVVDRPVASRQDAEALALSIMDGRARSFVTGSGRSLGKPALRAGGVVQLRGLGKKFSGSYYVVQSTHTLSEDGYTTSFGVQRNAVA
jgi:phage protein D